jgi:hypothetical protein
MRVIIDEDDVRWYDHLVGNASYGQVTVTEP